MSHSDHYHPPADKPVMWAILTLAIIYALSTAAGLTEKLFGGHAPAEEVAAEADEQPAEQAAENGGHEPAEAPAEEGGHHVGAVPHLFSVLPFVLLLGAIAMFPLLSWTSHWWESNRNRFIIAAGLGVITLVYYLFIYEGGGLHKVLLVLNHAILLEYIPFIVLLFSLYTISGGIRIEGDLRARPLTNSTFIAIGAVLASFIGTTGAAMLLIRPLLETNRERRYVQHTVIFFIFVVCNCGGCLLPIGDPPLFLGYLYGVPFLWTFEALWPAWLATNVVLIVIYYLWDSFFCYPREAVRDVVRDKTQVRPLRIVGMWPNALLLLGVVLCVALLDPSKAVPGTEWHPWPYLREVAQLSLVGFSLLLGSRQVRINNRFNYSAIVEVAALFIGIFICMQPALEILGIKGSSLGIDTPMKFFWASGSLSSILDNAPTYVVFYETAGSRFGADINLADLLNVSGPDGALATAYLIGISLGAVFMGSMTYIGNGPNFMVRSIAEQSGVKMPSFMGYVFRYSIPILIPVFVAMSYIFLVLLAPAVEAVK